MFSARRVVAAPIVEFLARASAPKAPKSETLLLRSFPNLGTELQSGCAPASAHERGHRIELVACRIEDMIPEVPDDSGRTARLDSIHLVPHLYRWTLDLETGEVHGEQLDDRATEFPRANPNSWTRAARYSYNPHIAPRAALSFDGLIKYDQDTGGSEHRSYPSGWLGGEAVFAPRPGASEEDDGWVLTALTHPDEDHSELWVLNGQDFLGEPQARVELPWRIPLGFHAEWAPLEAP